MPYTPSELNMIALAKDLVDVDLTGEVVRAFVANFPENLASAKEYFLAFSDFKKLEEEHEEFLRVKDTNKLWDSDKKRKEEDFNKKLKQLQTRMKKAFKTIRNDPNQVLKEYLVLHFVSSRYGNYKGELSFREIGRVGFEDCETVINKGFTPAIMLKLLADGIDQEDYPYLFKNWREQASGHFLEGFWLAKTYTRDVLLYPWKGEPRIEKKKEETKKSESPKQDSKEESKSGQQESKHAEVQAEKPKVHEPSSAEEFGMDDKEAAEKLRQGIFKSIPVALEASEDLVQNIILGIQKIFEKRKKSFERDLRYLTRVVNIAKQIFQNPELDALFDKFIGLSIQEKERSTLAQAISKKVEEILNANRITPKKAEKLAEGFILASMAERQVEEQFSELLKNTVMGLKEQMTSIQDEDVRIFVKPQIDSLEMLDFSKSPLPIQERKKIFGQIILSIDELLGKTTKQKTMHFQFKPGEEAPLQTPSKASPKASQQPSPETPPKTPKK